MKKNLVMVVSFVLLLCFVTACTVIDNRNVATVNGESIKLGSFNYYIQVSKSVIAQAAGTQVDANFWATADLGGKKAGDVAKEQALDQAINDVIISQKAKEMGIVIDDAGKQAIGKQKGDMIQQFGGQEQYLAEIKKYNITDKDISDSIEKSYLKQKLFEKLSAEDATFKVEPAALKDYYSKNFMKARHILLSTVDDKQQPLPQDQIDAAKNKADQLLAQLKAGADFGKLMTDNSQDPGSKTQPDGYVFGKGEMVKEFEDATAALKDGELSPVVQSQFGYHIIQRLNLMEAYDKYIADAQSKTKVENGIRSEIFNKKIEEWKSAAKVVKNDTELKNVVVK